MTSTYQNKIVEHDRLLAAVSQARASGKRIVQCHGCFDIVHPGPIRYLEFARQQGNILIVSLTGDLELRVGFRPAPYSGPSRFCRQNDSARGPAPLTDSLSSRGQLQ